MDPQITIKSRTRIVVSTYITILFLFVGAFLASTIAFAFRNLKPKDVLSGDSKRFRTAALVVGIINVAILALVVITLFMRNDSRAQADTGNVTFLLAIICLFQASVASLLFVMYFKYGDRQAVYNVSSALAGLASVELVAILLLLLFTTPYGEYIFDNFGEPGQPAAAAQQPVEMTRASMTI